MNMCLVNFYINRGQGKNMYSNATETKKKL